MKILLLGKGGQVGWELQRSLAPLGGQLRDFLRNHLGPLAKGVVVDTEKHATTITYRALVPLTRGYLADLADFADYLAEGD